MHPEGAGNQSPVQAGWEGKAAQVSEGLGLSEADRAMIRSNPEVQKRWIAMLDTLEQELLALRKEMLGE